jgi:hypothetical protein
MGGNDVLRPMELELLDTECAEGEELPTVRHWWLQCEASHSMVALR